MSYLPPRGSYGTAFDRPQGARGMRNTRIRGLAASARTTGEDMAATDLFRPATFLPR